MLLPGFEKNNDYWRELINFAVNSSDAAVFAFDESRFSQGDNFEQLKKLTERFGNNIIYAITQSDASKDDNEEVRQSCIKALEIRRRMRTAWSVPDSMMMKKERGMDRKAKKCH